MLLHMRESNADCAPLETHSSQNDGSLPHSSTKEVETLKCRVNVATCTQASDPSGGLASSTDIWSDELASKARHW